MQGLRNYWIEGVVVLALAGAIAIFVGWRRGRLPGSPGLVGWWDRHVAWWLVPVTATTGALVVVTAPYLFDGATGRTRVHVASVLILVQVAVVGLPFLSEQLKQRAVRNLVADQLQGELEFLGQVQPLTVAIKDLLAMPVGPRKLEARGTATTAALTAAALTLGVNRQTRATFYQCVREGGVRVLDPRNSVGGAGRGGQPAHFKFREGTLLGNEVFEALDQRKARACPDIASEPLSGWSTAAHDEPQWRSFLAVPVVSGRRRLVGMLTVDSLAVGEFQVQVPDNRDTLALLTIAHLYAVAMTCRVG